MQWGELITLEYGKPVPDKESISGPVPVFGTNGPIGTSFLPPLCNHPSFILGRKGAYRGVHYSSIPFSVIDTAFYAEPISDLVDLKWAYYKFLTYDINRMDSGSAIPSTDRYEVYAIDVDLPSLETQKKIVSVLDSIDTKIQVNSRINDNLEQQAQALYKSWFVDFAPFGNICPEHWVKTDIYSVARIIYGAPFSSKLFNTDQIGKPIVRIRDLREQVLVTYTTEVHSKGHLIQPGDIVVGMDGEFRPYLWGNTEAWLNQRVCIFESKEAIDKAFVLFTIKPLLNVIEQTQVATTVIHIGKKDFDSFEILMPDRDTLDNFGSITAPILNKIVSNRLENKHLAELRDALLPRLMSGEIDVSDTQL